VKQSSDFPPLWCDFNACGLSGKAGDNCFYVLDKVRVREFKAGDRVFLYMDDGDADGVPSVVGIEGELIVYDDRLIARPLGKKYYYGPRWW